MRERREWRAISSELADLRATFAMPRLIEIDLGGFAFHMCLRPAYSPTLDPYAAPFIVLSHGK